MAGRHVRLARTWPVTPRRMARASTVRAAVCKPAHPTGESCTRRAYRVGWPCDSLSSASSDWLRGSHRLTGGGVTVPKSRPPVASQVFWVAFQLSHPSASKPPRPSVTRHARLTTPVGRTTCRPHQRNNDRANCLGSNSLRPIAGARDRRPPQVHQGRASMVVEPDAGSESSFRVSAGRRERPPAAARPRPRRTAPADRARCTAGTASA